MSVKMILGNTERTKLDFPLSEAAPCKHKEANMRNLHVLLLVLALGLASGQTAPAEVRDTNLNMLGPLLSLAAKALSIDPSTGIEHLHLAAVLDGAIISEHDRLLTVHGDRTFTALVTVAAQTPLQPACPLEVLLGSEAADESSHGVQDGRRITILPAAEVTRRLQSTSIPGALLPGPSPLSLPLDQRLTVSAVRLGDPIPDSENPLNGLIVFYMYLSTDAERMPPGAPGVTTDD